MSYEITHCIHLPLRQQSGAPEDALGNVTPSFLGTSTSAWSDPTYLTFTSGDGLSIEVTGAYIDETLRLDTLEGSIFWSMELYHEAAPTSARDYLFCYGPFRSAATGGYAFGMGTTQNFLIQYGAIGNGNVSYPNDLCEPMGADELDTWFQIGACIHRFDGEISVSGFIRGRTERGGRLFDLEAAPPTLNNAIGLRLFGDPDSAGSAQNEWGNEAGMNARARNVVIARLEGDALRDIPAFMYDLRGNPEIPLIRRTFEREARILVGGL